MWSFLLCLGVGGAVVLWVHLKTTYMWEDINVLQEERHRLREDVLALQRRVETLSGAPHTPPRKPPPFNDGA